MASTSIASGTSSRTRLARYVPWLVASALILLFAIFFIGLAFNQHAGFRTHKADLGQMDQAIWNSGRGRFVEAIKDDFLSTRLTDHVEPIYILIGQIFWLWNDVRALLVLQVLAVALGAIPLFLLARQKLGDLLAMAVITAYLLNPSLQSAVLTEFHAIPLAVPLILWAFWAVEARKWTQFFIAAFLVAMVKEEAALLAAGLGLWALWRAWLGQKIAKTAAQPPVPIENTSKNGILAGAAILILSIFWFYIATFIIVPAHGQALYHTDQSLYFQRYGVLGNSPVGILKNIIFNPRLVGSIATEPARLRYLLGLFAGFGFLSLFGIDVLVLALPVLLANLLSAYPAQFYGDFHYTAPLIPYFAVAAVYGSHRLLRFVRTSRLRPKWFLSITTIWVLLWAGMLYARVGRGPLGGHFDKAPITSHHRLLPRFLAQIPPRASVTATASLHPHLSHRRFIYQFPFGLQAKPPAHPAQWALLDVTSDTDMAPGDLYDYVQQMLAADWGVVDAIDGFLLLRRGAPQKTLPPAFYNFARTSDDPQALTQTSPLTVAGVNTSDWPRWRQTKVITQWLVGQAYKSGTVRPWLEVRRPSGQTLYTFEQIGPPALIWYPPEAWQPGDRITITTLPLSLPKYWGAVVAVVHGPDPKQTAHRLPASQVAPHAIFSSADGTLALMAAYRRMSDNTLALIPPARLTAPCLADFLQPDNHKKAITFRTSAGDLISLQARLPSTPPTAGRFFDFWLHWQPGIPADNQLFVHLRHSGQNSLQHDGPPVVFVQQAAESAVNDWRELRISTEHLSPGEQVDLVLGIYNPRTGQRLDILGPNDKLAGNEQIMATYTVAPPPAPDQACALIPATCLSQP